MKTSFKYALVAAAGLALACGSVPKSVREYASALPGRADGQYAVLDTPIKKQLVMMDAMLQCAIDAADKKKEEESAACKCGKSSSPDWIADCKGWLGSHAPAGDAPSPPPPGDTPTPAPGTGSGSN